jgi:RAD51-like protein 2
VMTFSRELDDLLGGGVPLKQLTEFAGAPGVGKTQLAMQLALNAQIPIPFGGVDGTAVYIDTEGSFLAHRALQMAEALVAHLRAAAANDEQRAAAARLQPQTMLDRLLVYRVHDSMEQLAAIRAVSELALERPLRLIAVDSIAFHLRHADLSYTKRLQMVGSMAQTLTTLATTRSLAAVVINQVTTKVNDALHTSSLVPALGESWAHVCHVQLMLAWRDGQRLATLYKGGPPGEAAYAVSADGVRSSDALAPPPPVEHAQQRIVPQSQQPPPTRNSAAPPTHGGGGAQVGKRAADEEVVARPRPPPAMR